MKKLPLGKSDFKDIIQNNFVYVDKTKYIYDLIESGDVFFLSRPRRFGKSLTVSTLYYLFKGEKELFKDTWIYDKWNWEKWPVLKIDMSEVNPSYKYLIKSLEFNIKRWGKDFGIVVEGPTYSDMFGDLIEKIHEKYRKNIVVLIDEYDAALLSNLTDKGLEEIREIMGNFYVQIKNHQEIIRFVFITGISKFSKVSIFSKMNNLIDLTMNEEYSTMFGYVEEEIDRYYREHIEVVKERLNMSEEEFWEKIREWYNGYSWDGKNKVYNPDSITRFFFEKDFQNYWFSTGTPTFLVNYIKRKGVAQLSQKEYSVVDINSYEIEDAPLSIFLWQAGYLTVVDKNKSLGYITFDYPNREVKQSFSRLIASQLLNIETVQTTKELIETYRRNAWKEFVDIINKRLSEIPYTMIRQFKTEGHWQTLMYMILSAVFGNVIAEEMSYKGRADLVVIYDNKVLVIELKMDKSAKEAIKQIKDRGYADKYRGKEVWIMGMNIDSRQRKIVEYLVEKR